MSVLNKLASALDRRDEVPNQELAASIVKEENTAAIRELVENLSNKNKAIQNDCIKVLYEIGAQDPRLISSHQSNFLIALNSKNNRLQWGAMAALDCIAIANPEETFAQLSKILDASDKGSVITRDHAVNILIKLTAHQEYAGSTFPLLTEQLMKAPEGQFPMYAERALPIINDQNKAAFLKVLHSRIGELEKESKKKRVEKVIKRVSK